MTDQEEYEYLGRMYQAAALAAFEAGISTTDEDQLIDWIQQNCNYRPSTEFFLFLGIGAALADLWAQSRGYKDQFDEAGAKARAKIAAKSKRRMES